MLKVLGISELQAERQRKKTPAEKSEQALVPAFTSLFSPAKELDFHEINTEPKSLKNLFTKSKTDEDIKNIEPVLELEKPVEAKKEQNTCSNYRTELPSKTPGVKFYVSVVRPTTPTKLVDDSKAPIIKKNTQSLSPVPPISNPSISNDPKPKFARRNTINPIRKQSTLRIVNKPEISENNSFSEKNENFDLTLQPSEETRKFLNRIKELQKSKKRCAAESELLKTYQKLINYIP